MREKEREREDRDKEHRGQNEDNWRRKDRDGAGEPEGKKAPTPWRPARERGLWILFASSTKLSSLPRAHVSFFLI